MAINYPGSLDNFTNPTSASPINSPSHADQHSNANDAIEALEAKVGSNNSVVTTSHDYKIAQLESLVTSSVAGAKSIYQDVRNQSGSAFIKATPVYVSGSEGASGKILILAASNASEANSSKTMGLTASAISNNSNGQVISEGILEGIDTTGAVDGDPVWLGVNGAKIYGLLNKPSAPAHLVFLGIVIRGGQANTGSMYVNIQNGFELQELHNVEISSLINGNILAYDSSTSTWKNTNTLQSTSSTVPLIIKRVNSQTSNLQEWRDQSGGMLAFFNKDGALTFNSSSSIGGTLNVFTSYAGNTGVIIRGFASQTANLQEWQDSAGGVLLNIDSTGSLDIGAGSSNVWKIKNQTSAVMEWQPVQGFMFLPYGASNRPVTIKGAASQTGDLTQWQNSAGTVLARIDANGQGALKSTTLTASSSGGSALTLVAASGQTAPLLTTAGGAQISAGGNYFISPGIQSSYSMGASAGAANIVALIVKGAPSQTADLQQWQNSAGTVLSQVYASGNARFSSGTASGEFKIVSDLGNSSWFGVYNTSTSKYYGISGQLPGPAGTITLGGYYAGVGVGGSSHDTNTPIFAVATPTNATPTTAPVVTYDTGETRLRAQSAGYTPLKVIGAASQTANLQEWQNSAGVVVSSISNAGLATFSNAGVTNNINAYYGKISANTQALGYLGQLSTVTANASTIG